MSDEGTGEGPMIGAFPFLLQLRQLIPVLLLGILFAIQFYISPFFDPQVWVPALLALSFYFLVHVVTNSVAERHLEKRWYSVALFGFDLFMAFVLLSVTKVEIGIIQIFFLIPIAGLGLIYGTQIAFTAAMWALALIAYATTRYGTLSNTQLVLSLALNGVGLFAVAALTSRFRAHFLSLEGKVQELGKDVSYLQNLSDLVLENLETGVLCWLEKPEKKFFANPAAYKILGNPSKEGLNLEALAEIERIIHTGSRIQENHPAIFRLEKLITFGERARTLEITVSHFSDQPSDTLGAIVWVQDLTDLRSLESQLRQREKLAAVGQLAAGIAHEIRNPLASMSGSIELLASQIKTETSEDKKLMNIVVREIDRLNRLISEFLDFVKPDQRLIDRINLNAFVQECLELVKLNPKLRVQGLEFESSNQDIFIMANKDKLKQAILNLTINALQATELAPEQKVQVRLQIQNARAVIFIKDNGSGIKPENLDRIFEPFFTTKSKGTGLGLAVTHKIIEAHGGHISVVSEPDKGCEFKIDLPLSPDPL